MGYVVFLRVPTSLFVAAVVFLPLSFSGWPVLLAACKAFPFMLAAMFAFAINDLLDIEKDRVSKPHRALPSGALSLKGARISATCSFVLCCAASLAFSSSVLELAIYSTTLAGAAFYNVVVKKAAEAKVFVTALVSMMPFIFSVCLLRDSQGAWSIATVLFFYISARELKMDVRDEEGDRGAGICTIAIRFGKTRCLRLSYCLLAISAVLYAAFLDLHDFVAVGSLILFLVSQLAIEAIWLRGDMVAKRVSILAQWLPMAIVFFSLV